MVQDAHHALTREDAAVGSTRYLFEHPESFETLDRPRGGRIGNAMQPGGLCGGDYRVPDQVIDDVEHDTFCPVSAQKVQRVP